MQLLLDLLCSPDTVWVVVHSRTTGLIAPDNFGEIGIVPLSPNCCIIANVEGGEISSDNAIAINHIAIDKSSMYYFARDLATWGI